MIIKINKFLTDNPILERYQIKPWQLIEIRKKVKEASIETLSNTLCDSPTISGSQPGIGTDQRRPGRCRTRIGLVKKKSALAFRMTL